MKKQFAVIGLGRFGSSVAKTLYSMGCQVLAIDQDEERVRAIVRAATRAVAADATDEQVLRSIGIRNFDVVIVGIGGNIQASIMITLMLKELGVKHVVAKAQSDLHGKVLYRVGADRVVFPERDMGFRVARNLFSSNILEYIELSQDAGVVEIVAPENTIGKDLKQLDLRNRYNINVIAIKHGETINITPRADDRIHEGDVLVVIGLKEDLQRFEQGGSI
ncbi:MAG: TrkA family potassium uptake protein [Firmicutes bacterium]|nr:TrkA family potassium uptake protein [Bacillota bacterium]